jgi:hypothetical protein
LAAGASATAVLVKGFDPPPVKMKPPEQLLPESAGSSSGPWVYHELDPKVTADTAHRMYHEGGCMYAAFGSIITQLAQQFGAPYSTFPVAMMKYGVSGIGEYGSICGALNGAAAIIGLFVAKKEHQAALIEDMFTWYEKTALPVYTPPEAKQDIVKTVAGAVLCHVSTVNWAKASGYRIDSKERSERCSRLTADVTQRLVELLNRYMTNHYVTASAMEVKTAGCIQCHGKTGKLGTVRGQMKCDSCHSGSVAHTLFGDVHYRFMK